MSPSSSDQLSLWANNDKTLVRELILSSLYLLLDLLASFCSCIWPFTGGTNTHIKLTHTSAYVSPPQRSPKIGLRTEISLFLVDGLSSETIFMRSHYFPLLLSCHLVLGLFILERTGIAPVLIQSQGPLKEMHFNNKRDLSLSIGGLAL